jgi:VCBS repeat-containing protein
MGAKLFLLPLEQRQLFDGAGLVAGLEVVDASRQNADDASKATAEKVDLTPAAFAPPSADGEVATNAIGPLKELLVIDPSVENWQSLTTGLDARAEIFVLDASKDGLQQLASKLSAHEGQYSSLHILSHGDVGRFRLGSRTVDAQAIADNSSEFSQIGEGIAEGGDVLIYGCDVGSGLKGQAFLQAIAQATHRDVAASNNKTGGHLAGGDWTLETTVGTIAESSVIGEMLLEDVGYQYLLAAENRAPIAVADFRGILDNQVIANGEALRGNLLGDNADSDPDGDQFTVAGIQIGVVPGPIFQGVNTNIVGVWGTLIIDSSGSYTYTPNANARALNTGESAAEVFTYTICDSSNAVASTTISIAIYGVSDTPANLVPCPIADVRTLCESQVINDGQATRGNLLGDKADTDPEGLPLVVCGAAVGDVALGAALFTGVETPLNGRYGTLSIKPDGSYSYTPNANAIALNQGQSGSDVFTYTVCDAGGLTANTTISITVCGESAPLNSPPVARNDLREICEVDAPLTGQAILGNSLGDVKDTDPDNDALKVNGVQAGVQPASVIGNVGTAVIGQWGTLVLAADGSYTYTPSANAQTLSAGETVQDVFTYSICDTAGAASTAQITINVCGQNDAPIARDDVRTTGNTTTITNGEAIIGNTFGDTKDGDPDRRDVLTVVGVRPGTEDPNCLPAATGGDRASAAERANVNQPIAGTYGTLTLKPDGSYTYQPNAVAAALLEGQRVQDVFTYSVSDGKSGSDCAQITIRTEGTAKAPVVVPPVVVPPVVVPPVVVPPTAVDPPAVIPPVVTTPAVPVVPVVPTTPRTPIVPLIFTPPTVADTPRAPLAPVALIPAVLVPRAPLNLGSAIVAEQAGTLPVSPFGDLPRAVKGFVEEAVKPQKVIDDCVPTKPAVTPKAFVAAAKPKVKPTVFAEAVEKPNKAFSEQVKTAAKRMRLPAKVAPRVVEKEC